MFGQTGLTIRQFERNDVVLEGEFEVGAAHQGQVALSGRNGAVVDSRTVRITVSDISAGGLGFQVPVFLPRMLTGVVRIFDLHGSAGASKGIRTRRIAFEHAVRIRRCELTTRQPSYFVGSSFENADDRLDAALAALTERIGAAMCRLGAPAGDNAAAAAQEISGA